MREIVKHEFSQFPGHSLSMFLVSEVQNAGDIRQMVMSGSLEPEASIIDAAMVQEPMVLLAAAGIVLHNYKKNALRARSLHAELVYTLSGSKHIGSSLGTFGIKDTCKDIIIARFDASDEDMARLQEIVNGSVVPLDSVSTCRNEKTIKKYYKISDQELEIGTMEDAVICRIAARDCM